MPDSTGPVILITGVTGFIGGCATAHLLLKSHACRILLLVRAENEELARKRALQSITRFEECAALESGLRRCQIIVGDLTNPVVLADPRLDEVTHVLHLAANTSFRSVAGGYQTIYQAGSWSNGVTATPA